MGKFDRAAREKGEKKEKRGSITWTGVRKKEEDVLICFQKRNGRGEAQLSTEGKGTQRASKWCETGEGKLGRGRRKGGGGKKESM